MTPLSNSREITSGGSGEKEAVIQEISAGKNVLRAISAPLFGPDGQVVGTVTVLENISAFKQLDQMKSDFVNMVAHELRSPLVSMRQLNSVLLEGLAGALGEKQRDFIGRGTKKIDALLDLIKDLLDVAKIEAGQFRQHKVPTDIGRILDETVTLMRPRAEEQGVELALACENLPPVQADPKSLEEIFNNLISNAVNYSPDGGKVTVTPGAWGSISK
jgi:two-component system, OmpR family, phosphate regulon sensor histidine kinase PhoR